MLSKGLALALAVGAAFAHAQETAPVHVDIPVVEASFNFLDEFYTFPSMRQSVNLSTAYYQTGHRLIGGEHRRPPFWRMLGIAGFDVLSFYLPLGNAWMHEEWHRATLTRRNIASYNDVNRFPIGRELIAVSHVTDEDLVRFKRDHPAEHVRMSAAGMESQTMQNLLIERRHFFEGAQTYDTMLLWINNFNNFFYLSSCASGQADSSTDSQNEDDGSSIPKRDFTGLDCTAWAYDLFRPDEPYAARGMHPSGVGLDRYIRNSDLNDRESKFLRKQVWLSVLNFADPNLIGRRAFQSQMFGHDVKWNARLSHFLTSFGYTVDANLFLNVGGQKFMFRLHNGFNNEVYFPGFTLESVDLGLTDHWRLSTQLTLWNQPRAQRVVAKGGEMLVGGGTRLSYRRTDGIQPYVGVDAKTPGWMAGNVFLDRNVTFWSGAQIELF